MAITLRTIKGTALTYVELDGNFSDLDNRIDAVETELSNAPDIGSEPIDFGSNLISYSNTVADESGLANYNPNTYTGMTVQVESTGALYYAHNGAWRKLLTDVTYGSPVTQGYVNPLSNLAYTGSFNDLSDVPPVFSFDGSYTSLTDKPTIPQDISELADINSLLFSSDYNDLINKPAIPVDISTLTDNNNIIPQDVSDLSDTTNVIPQDVSDLTDTTNVIPRTLGELTNNVGFITLGDIPDNNGNFNLSNSIISTDDSSAIIMENTVVFKSDIYVEQGISFDGSATVDFTGVNVVGLQVAQQGTTFTSNVEFQAGVDFTGATITGLPGAGDQTVNTTDDVLFNSVTANTFTTIGTGNPTFNSGADFTFNTGNNAGVLSVNGSISATSVLELTAQSSAPVAVSGSFAVANGVDWDPASKSGTDPYPVFYDGTTWNALY